MKEKRDNGKFLYVAITIAVVMIVGLYIDSSSESGILFSPGKSVYSVDVLPEEQDDETMTTDNAIEDEIFDDNIDDEPIQTDDVEEPQSTADVNSMTPQKTDSQSSESENNKTTSSKPAATKAPLTLNKTDTVYITASGSKFHIKNDCGNMNPNNAKSLTVEEALAKGKEPCKRCLKNVKIN